MFGILIPTLPPVRMQEIDWLAFPKLEINTRPGLLDQLSYINQYPSAVGCGSQVGFSSVFIFAPFVAFCHSVVFFATLLGLLF